mgnify:CR=1 FL=1
MRRPRYLFSPSSILFLNLIHQIVLELSILRLWNPYQTESNLMQVLSLQLPHFKLNLVLKHLCKWIRSALHLCSFFRCHSLPSSASNCFDFQWSIRAPQLMSGCVCQPCILICLKINLLLYFVLLKLRLLQTLFSSFWTASLVIDQICSLSSMCLNPSALHSLLCQTFVCFLYFFAR